MSDLISRQKVMGILTNLSYNQCKTHGEADVIETAKTLVITMPPAQSDVPDTNVGDMISRQAAIDAVKHAWAKGLEPTQFIEDLPSAQPEITLESAIDYLHSIGWMQEHDRILSSAQSDNSCDGCKYENAEDGVPVPCGFCKRSHPDNYERRTDGVDS